jgi:uncharacterized membrane protein YgcG
VSGAQDAAGDGSEDPNPSTRPGVDYRGAPLDAERGPGLGCFWLQVVVLAVVVVLTPLSAAWEWPVVVTIVLLAATLVLLLFVGQTVIFLLRLVAADRRATGRRRPLRSATKTVGELEDEPSRSGDTGGDNGGEAGGEAGDDLDGAAGSDTGGDRGERG